MPEERAEKGRAIAQNASVDDSLTFGKADPTITSLEDVHLDSTLVLIGCGASKRDPKDPTDLHLATVGPDEQLREHGPSGPAWRAEDLYTSTYFGVKREFAEVVTAWANSRDATPWAVLSAEHGILPHWQDVTPYDTTIDDLGDNPENPDHHVKSSIVRRRPDGREIVTEMDLWATNVAYGLARWLSGYRERGDAALTSRVNSLLVLAGQDYIQPLRDRGVFKYGISRMAGNPNENLAQLDADVRFLFEEIDAEGIGEQMAWLSDTVDTLDPLVNDVEETEQDTLVTDGGRAISQIDPENADTHDYLIAIEGGETALHVYLKDDKEWWLAHNEGGDYPGALNGPWLYWHTYPSGPWVLDYCTREILAHHVDELYYVDYDGEEAHSVHEVDVVALADAPEFVRGEFDAE